LSSCRRAGWAVLASAILAPVVCAGPLPDDGGVVGWVESTRGAPVAGAVVSIFGKGIRGGSLIALADAQGQFVLPSLPAGSYTLRAIGSGHQPSAAQLVTVLPNRDALFTLSLTPVGGKPAAEESAAEEATEGEREWRWLVRHKRRSVLETVGHDPATEGNESASALSLPDAPQLAALGPLAGSMEFAATAGSGAPAEAARLGLLHGTCKLEEFGAVTAQMVAELLAGKRHAQTAIKSLLDDMGRPRIDQALIEDTARRLAQIRATPEAQAALADFLAR